MKESLFLSLSLSSSSWLSHVHILESCLISLWKYLKKRRPIEWGKKNAWKEQNTYIFSWTFDIINYWVFIKKNHNFFKLISNWPVYYGSPILTVKKSMQLQMSKRFILSSFNNVPRNIYNHNTAPLRREGTYRVFHGFATTQLEITQDVIGDNQVMKLQTQSSTNKTAL